MSEDPYTSPREFLKAAGWLENKLRLPPGFITALPQDDDWSFIIKAHALIEAALTNQIAVSIGPRLAPASGQLDLGDRQKGKIAFAEALGIIDSGQREFIQLLSELRNNLVRNVREVSFNLGVHVSHLHIDKRSKFIEAITYFAKNSEPYRSQAARHPKETIWAGTLVMLMLTTSQGEGHKRERKSVQSKSEKLDDVIEAFSLMKT